MNQEANFVQSKEVGGFVQKNLPTLITVASLASIVAIVMLVSYPRFKDLLTSRKELSDQTQKVEAMNQKLSGLKGLDEEKLVENASILKTAVPIDKDVNGLIIGLQQLASQNGTSLVQLSLTPGNVSSSEPTKPAQDSQTGESSQTQAAGPQAASGSPTVDFTATFKGDYAAMENLLKSSTESLRIISIKTVKITPSASAEGGIEMLLNAKAYWKAPGNLGDYSDPLPTLGANSKVIEELNQFKVVSGQPQPLPTGTVTNPF